MDSLLSKAIEYVQRNWKIFPLHSAKNSACSCGNRNCTSVAKHPRIKEWQKECSSEAKQIEDWWSKWPDANIGLATGNASGCFVVDIDPRHGGKESLQQLIKQYGMLPRTLASHTGGGGFHLFFKMPGAKIGNRTNVLPGIDVREMAAMLLLRQVNINLARFIYGPRTLRKQNYWMRQNGWFSY